MTLRLSYDYLSGETTTIPEAVTTIPAGTLRLLLTSISYRAKARKEMRREPPMVPRRPAAPPLAAGLSRRVEDARPPGLTTDPVPDCKPPGMESIETPPGLHSLPSYIHYYNRRPVLTCTASRRGGGIWYRLSASGRWQALQRGAGGIIAACVGLVFVAVERVQSQEKPL